MIELTKSDGGKIWIDPGSVVSIEPAFTPGGKENDRYCCITCRGSTVVGMAVIGSASEVAGIIEAARDAERSPWKQAMAALIQYAERVTG